MLLRFACVKLSDDARFYGENEDAFGSAALRELSISRLDLEALKNAMSTALPFVVRASSAADIDAAMALAGEYDLDLVVLGGEEAWRRSGDLAASETPVIVKAYANVPVQFDRLGARFDNAALLAKAGVRVVLSTLETHNARNLRFEAGQAVRHGMKWEEALRAVTLTLRKSWASRTRTGHSRRARRRTSSCGQAIPSSPPPRRSTSSSGAARSSTTPDRFDCSSATRTSTADPCNTWETQHPEKTGLESPSQDLNALESHQPRTSKMASTSMGWFPGSDAMPTALRPPLPLSSPKTSTSSSLKPLTT